eukprot:TRINITY_DN2339_c0_g1_i2.p1 TRINITY_DN2339_c0_g1~~TRINITY_DN2339_c0_g1_i2.p1  ORF type:complete len:349 (-),score=23.79 TRINITY_DN2339_c0_g1_i2:233-1216(-)
MSRLQKILLVGGEKVGKSSLIKRFSEDEFGDAYHATIGIDFKMKHVAFDGGFLKLQLWDTAGQPRFRQITKSYYRTVQGIILVFDVTNRSSFEGVAAWFEEICGSAPDAVKLLVGTKSDSAERVVSFEQATGLARELKVPYLDVSSKTNDNVETAFFKVVCKIAGVDFRLPESGLLPLSAAPPKSSTSTPASAAGTATNDSTSTPAAATASQDSHTPATVHGMQSSCVLFLGCVFSDGSVCVSSSGCVWPLRCHCDLQTIQTGISHQRLAAEKRRIEHRHAETLVLAGRRLTRDQILHQPSGQSTTRQNHHPIWWAVTMHKAINSHI